MRALVGLLLALTCTAAAAQLRTIPADAKRGVLRPLSGTAVEIDGQPTQLSAGAQIRGISNRIVLPTALTSAARVKYQLNEAGQVHRVWILSPEEAAQPDTGQPQGQPQPQAQPQPQVQ